MEDNTASERTRTVAATYGCRILQLYEYDEKYSVLMKMRPLIGRRIRIGRRVHVTQPLQLGVKRCRRVSVLSADLF